MDWYGPHELHNFLLIITKKKKNEQIKQMKFIAMQNYSTENLIRTKRNFPPFSNYIMFSMNRRHFEMCTLLKIDKTYILVLIICNGENKVQR